MRNAAASGSKLSQRAVAVITDLAFGGGTKVKSSKPLQYVKIRLPACESAVSLHLAMKTSVTGNC